MIIIDTKHIPSIIWTVQIKFQTNLWLQVKFCLPAISITIRDNFKEPQIRCHK